MTTVADLEFFIGETWDIPITIADADGEPLNVTGATVTWTLKDAPGGSTILSVSKAGGEIVFTDEINGDGRVTVVPASQSALSSKPGTYFHVLEAVLADGTDTVQGTGNFFAKER